MVMSYNTVAIIGAAGKVGFATASVLRKAGVPIRAILRDGAKTQRLANIGCEVAIADIQDATTLAKAIGDADAVQVIIPPSLHTDTANEMRAGIESIASALDKARPRLVLAISDYGAHIANEDIGMPTLCRGLESRLRLLDCRIHKLFLRSAEHMQGWARAIPVAVASGVLPSFHDPIDKPFPTISAPDLGVIAAELLLHGPGNEEVEIVHAEGPRRYSANDVAAALGQVLNRTISVQIVPRSEWKHVLERGMSASLAELLIKANDAQNKGGFVDVEPNAAHVCYGTTELIEALQNLLL